MSEEDLEEGGGGGGGGGGDEEEEEGVMDDNECWDEEEAEEQSLGQSPANDVELVIKPLPHGERTVSSDKNLFQQKIPRFLLPNFFSVSLGPLAEHHSLPEDDDAGHRGPHQQVPRDALRL